MLTADPCQPMPGPMGAVWPSAKPGIDYCGPYPACCPPVARTWWQHLIGLLNPHGDWSMIALEAACVVIWVAFTVFIFGGNALQRHWVQNRNSRGA
jgi:hypothetical protein